MGRFVSLLLWAYRTLNALPRRPHIFFSLIGRRNSPHQSDFPSELLVLVSKISGSYDRIGDTKALEERRHIVENKWLSYQKQTNKAYMKRVRPWALFVGDLTLQAT